VFNAMLATVVFAALFGARSHQAVVDWLHAMPVEGWHLLGYWRRPPQYGAIRNLLIANCPDAFQRALSAWTQEVLRCHAVWKTDFQ